MNQSENKKSIIELAKDEVGDSGISKWNDGFIEGAEFGYNQRTASLIQTIENRVKELEEEVEYEKAFAKDVSLQEYAAMQFKHLLTLITP